MMLQLVVFECNRKILKKQLVDFECSRKMINIVISTGIIDYGQAIINYHMFLNYNNRLS